MSRSKALYVNVMAFKAQGLDAKSREATRTNLEAVEALGNRGLRESRQRMLVDDRCRSRTVCRRRSTHLRADLRAIRALRFVKSNNNPSRNFKKKTDLQTELAARAEKLAGEAPQSLKGAAERGLGRDRQRRAGPRSSPTTLDTAAARRPRDRDRRRPQGLS